jgi:hypothetical protein
MHRLLLSLIAATFIAAPAPTSAGTKEDTFLAGLVGIWSGTGKLIGSKSGQLTCNSTFRTVGDGVYFRVNCDIAEFGKQVFSGTLAYNDDEGRYESKSTGGEITIGTKTGNAVVFTMKMRGIAPGTSVMKLSAAKIIVDTKVKRPGSSGSEIRSYIELKKS